MRIGIMLRAFEEKGGVGVYTRNITRELIRQAPQHEFFLYFRSPEFIGEFEGLDNVTARIVRAPGKALWDQIAMPLWFHRDRLDVIFHPKFTVPLLCPGRGVMVLHGAGWFIPETKKFWSRTTRIYTRVLMPIYCRVAGAVLAVSHITRDVFIDKLGVAPEKISTVYFAAGPQFRERFSEEQLEAVRAKYGLPANFMLTLSGGNKDDRKNFGTILDAYRRIHNDAPTPFVVAGRGCDAFRERYGIPDEGYGKDIFFPGWVDQKDLPALYQLATVFVYPSNMEAFPIPITEALTSGTPTVTSNVFGLKELAGDAARLVDPADPAQISAAVLELLGDEEERESLRRKALERSRIFDWEKCAQTTLGILERVGTR